MDFDSFVRSNKIINLALVMGICFMSMVLFFVLDPKNAQQDLPFNSAYLVALAIFPWFGSRFIYRAGVMKAAKNNNLKDKLLGYRASFIIACAIAEGFALLGLMSYFYFTRDSSLLFVAGVAVVSLLLLHPTKDRIISELGLSREEQKELNRIQI